MDKKEKLPRRKQNHITSFDYSENHHFFITICSDNRKRYFSDISVGEVLPVGETSRSDSGGAVSGKELAPPAMRLSAIGKIAEEQLLLLQNRYSSVTIENYVIMPNHIHILLLLENTGGASPSPTLHDVICAYKSLVTRECRHRGFQGVIWQRSYFEHIIRNEDDYKNTWTYIDNNPARWAEDEYYQGS